MSLAPFIGSFLVTLLVLFAVPFFVYGALASFGIIETPEGPPARFLLGVLISKAGTAFAFVALFSITRDEFGGQWPLYAAIWFTMFVLGEIGQALGPDYTWSEAVAGIISEAMYFPLAAYLVDRMIAA